MIKLRPSQAHAWLTQRCTLRPHIKDDRPSSSSLEGTRAHNIASELLQRGRSETPPDDSEMQAAVQMYVDYVNSREGKVFIETYVPLLGVTGGTPDAYVLSEEGALEIIDFKYGFSPVCELRNPQLSLYAIGCMQKHPGVTSVHLTIVQPRCPHPSGAIRTYEADLDWLSGLAIQTMQAYHAANEDPRARAGPSCRYCPRRYKCPALQDLITVLQDTTESRDVYELSDDEIQKHYALVKLTKDLASYKLIELDALVESRISQGKRVPGMQIMNRKSRRAWKEGLDFEGLGLTKRVQMTITEAEKVIDTEDINNYTEIRKGAKYVAPVNANEIERIFK